MDRLPALSAKQLVSILERHGFAKIRQRGSHATFRHPDGRTTTVSMHGDVPRGTLRGIMRQVGLSRTDLT